MSKRAITTFEADDDVARDLKRAIRLRAGKGGNQRGMLRRILNEALREHFRQTLSK